MIEGGRTLKPWANRHDPHARAAGAFAGLRDSESVPPTPRCVVIRSGALRGERVPPLGGETPVASVPRAVGGGFFFGDDRHPGLIAPVGSEAMYFENFGLTPRHQPASDSLRQSPEWDPSLGRPHVRKHEASNGRRVEKSFQASGEAFHARG